VGAIDVRQLLALGAALGAAACAARTGSTAAAPAAPAAAIAAQAPDKDYLVYVASEGNDRIALLRFGPSCLTSVAPCTPAPSLRVDHDFRIGTNPTELVGPHGIGLTPDGRTYYVSTAHGAPNGSLWKFSTAGDSALGHVELGRFPATLQVSPDGADVWVVNFNLHGAMVPSTVSVVYGDQMVEVARVTTCTMPHGSRLSPDGSRHYSACMMDDALVEIDARAMSLTRHFMLTKGMEHGMTGAPKPHAVAAMPAAGTVVGHNTQPVTVSGAAATSAMSHPVTCSPTWAQPSTDGRTVYVACNKANEILSVDVASWTLGRRIAAGDGVYNLAVTHDGRLLLGTNKRGQSVSIIDLATGRELARVPSSRKLPSGVTVSADDRYAFVTDEGIGAQPGTVDVIDLRTLTRVASVDVGQQAGGIDFWKTEAAH
jgi:DNA-binding beta-propeller fold protein YncE